MKNTQQTEAAKLVEFHALIAGTYARRIREIASDAADMVERGEMTEVEANEFVARWQDRLATA
jgi:hypothetical protein